MKKQAVEFGTSLWGKRGRMALLTLALTIGLVCLGLLVFGTSGVRADPAPAVNGVVGAGEWDASWRIKTDSTNDLNIVDFEVPPTLCNEDNDYLARPNDAPCYARSGFDLTALWLHFENGTLYARFDIDGTPGDTDSRTGSAGNLASGLPHDEDGPLYGADPNGIGTDEGYRLHFGYEESSWFLGASLVGGVSSTNNLLTQTVYPALDDHTPDSIGEWGSAAYSDVVEFALPVSTIFVSAHKSWARPVRQKVKPCVLASTGPSRY